MRWFERSITDAITEAKQRRVLFVVYIHGDDDESKKMDDTWEDTAVANVCEETQLVAMRFRSDSEECKQFSQYYPVLCVPSVSLIAGETGVPLEAVAGYSTPDDFAEKIKKVYATLKQQSGSKLPSSPAAPPTSGSPSAGVDGATVAGTTGGESPAASPLAAAPPPASSPPPPETEEKKKSVQERAARVRQKMEAIHRQKEAQKEEEVRRKEIERRKVGQKVQVMQQKRSEQEARELAEEIRKQKMEDKLAKERVREQIARDRAEKNARFSAERREREQSKAVKEAAKETEKAEEQKTKAKVNMDVTRLQFRLPDGSTVTEQFPSSSPLQEAQDFLAQHVGNSLKEFSFSTTFPRRRFAASDLSRSLLDLELAPSAAIVVLPGRYQSSPSSTAVASSSEGGGSFLMWLFGPLLFIWNAFYNFLFGSGSSSSSSNDQQPQPSAMPPPQSEEQYSQSASPTGARPKSSYVRRRTPGGDSSNYKKEGNIHRLVSNSDEDDENNTWNGNSTQQM